MQLVIPSQWEDGGKIMTKRLFTAVDVAEAVKDVHRGAILVYGDVDRSKTTAPMEQWGVYLLDNSSSRGRQFGADNDHNVLMPFVVARVDEVHYVILGGGGHIIPKDAPISPLTKSGVYDLVADGEYSYVGIGDNKVELQLNY